METIKGKASDLPTAPNANSKDAGLLAALSGPTDMVELRSALLKHGGKIKHAGGALPPLFPEKGVREGDARLVTYLGHDLVPGERSGGKDGGFFVLNFDVLDHSKPTYPVLFRAQMILNATLETYFQAVKCSELPDKKLAAKIIEEIQRDEEEFRVPTRDAEKTPILVITYGGQMTAKQANRTGAHRWIVEEFTPAKN